MLRHFILIFHLILYLFWNFRTLGIRLFINHILEILVLFNLLLSLYFNILTLLIIFIHNWTKYGFYSSVHLWLLLTLLDFYLWNLLRTFVWLFILLWYWHKWRYDDFLLLKIYLYLLFIHLKFIINVLERTLNFFYFPW